MLFYDEQDRICLKTEEGFKVLYERDYFELNGKPYVYSNDYFYDVADFGEGEYEIEWDKRTHPRHMGIVEKEEAFAPPSYKCDLDYIFEYDEEISPNLTEEQFYVMWQISRSIDNALERSKESASVVVENFEFKVMKKEGLEQVLELINDEYKFDVYYFGSEESGGKDKAQITIYLD